MSVADTSIKSYYELIEDKTFTEKQITILIKIQMGKHPSNSDISRWSGLPINTVCGLNNGLRKKDYVKIGGTKIDPFSRKTVYWYELTEKGKKYIGA